MTIFSSAPLQAQRLGKGVFKHHTHVHNPLVAGYPNPTNADARAELDALLNNPYISGIQMTYDWRHLEPSPGVYRWDIIDADLGPWAAIGKKVWIEIQTANIRGSSLAPRGYPDWLATAPYNVPIVGHYHVDASGESHSRYPVFWNTVYQDRWASFVTAFAARFNGHPSIEFIVPTGYSAGTEPRLSADDNEYYYDEWMAAGLDPGLPVDRVTSQRFYSSAEASSLGVTPVYLNTNLWAIDLFRSVFTQTRLMINIAEFDIPWQEERIFHAITQGIGIGNNGLTARTRSVFRDFSRQIQLTFGVPTAFFEFGPDTRIDPGADQILGTADDFLINLLELYKRGMGSDSDLLYSPWSHISYMPAGRPQDGLETEQEWMDALAWVFAAELSLPNQGALDLTAPTVPTGLITTAVTASSISLAWNPSSDNVIVEGYVLSRNGVPIATLSGTTYADTGLAEATSYSYTVKAFDLGGNSSALSNTLTVKTLDVSAPSVPTGLIASVITGSKVSLSWAAASDNVAVTGYIIYRGGVQFATTTKTTYTNTGLTQNTAYTYAVAAYDAAGNTSPQTANLRVTTLDVTAPSKPTGLAAIAAGASRIDLAWTAATDNVAVTGYKIFRDGVQIATSTKATYTNTGLIEATSYSYTIAAYDGAGNTSAQSAAVTAKTLDVTAPVKPTGLTATPFSKSQINLAWTATTDNVAVTGYKIFRDGVQIATTTTTSYSNTGLSEATNYSYTVAAYDGAGNTSVQSTTSNATTLDVTAPSIPTGLTATPITGARIDLAWGAATDNVAVTGYKVFRGGLQIATTRSLSYSDKTLAPGITYTYTVAAYDAAGNTSFQSAPVTPTTVH